MGTIICPKCEKDDQIQKITSIRSDGVTTSHYGNFYGGKESAVSITNLASRLSPPTNTYKMSSIGMWFFTWIILWAILTWVLTGLFKMALNTGIIVGGVVSGIGYFSLYQKARSQQKDAAEKVQLKMKNYVELYYCYRDDCVFDPKTNTYTSPEDMSRLL